MKLAVWEFQGIRMPMMEDESGELYCTSNNLCNALNINENCLRAIYRRHTTEFGVLSVANSTARELLKNHREEFGIIRVREDMRLWSEDDMLTFAFHSKSDKSIEFRRNLRAFVKQHARRNYVTQEEFNIVQGENMSLKGRLAQLDALQARVDKMASSMDYGASLAGTLLQSPKRNQGFAADTLGGRMQDLQQIKQMLDATENTNPRHPRVVALLKEARQYIQQPAN